MLYLHLILILHSCNRNFINATKSKLDFDFDMFVKISLVEKYLQKLYLLDTEYILKANFPEKVFSHNI